MMIALPSAVKTFNWLGTVWGGRIQFTTSMLFALSFVSMFIIGGLSGIFMAATPVDIFIHDTYFIVAHFHYVLFAGTAMGVWAAIYFWFPKMFGRTMNEFWGKVHFFLTFIFLNGTFFTMHILGAVGFPRRLADAYHYETFHHLQPLNAFMTWCAIGMSRRRSSSRRISSGACSSARSRAGIRGTATRWNGPLRARLGTATSTSSRWSIAVPTNTRCPVSRRTTSCRPIPPMLWPPPLPLLPIRKPSREAACLDLKQTHRGPALPMRWRAFSSR
jgi:Cytochrome C and Quinol oxidase polypeptide I